MNNLPSDLKITAQEQAILSNILYFVKAYNVVDGSSIGQILKDIAKNIKELSEDDVNAYKKVLIAVKNNPDLQKLTVNYQIKTTNPEGLNAAVFMDNNKKAFVVFRVTGGSEWLDNGYGLSGLREYFPTTQQDDALKYFDSVVQDLLANLNHLVRRL